MRNTYYIVNEMSQEVLEAAVSIGATAVIVGVPESLRETSILESWNLPHVWIEEIPDLNLGPDDVS